ncbi:hypothetical protein GWI33_005141 [Rhynchophorus ferrugineus]|uniref:Uncharacterized protein n=1 Tax=Rhynchophorus ferrugineus TaxID=354439 RepID=A0A834IU89_RHYFE|nr:hypothetical protein GWI33_005141 [Rhynchophorus ferrugineus]
MMLSQLPLPIRLRNIIGNLFAQTIRCCVPEPSALRDFVSRPPTGSARGLVPLLKGKRTSKIRPEFVIFYPQVEEYHRHHSPTDSKSSSSSGHSTTNASGGCSGSSESDPIGWDELNYADTLPELSLRLVEETSNIWGTKFKIHGLANEVPANLKSLRLYPSPDFCL